MTLIFSIYLVICCFITAAATAILQSQHMEDNRHATEMNMLNHAYMQPNYLEHIQAIEASLNRCICLHERLLLAELERSLHTELLPAIDTETLLRLKEKYQHVDLP